MSSQSNSSFIAKVQAILSGINKDLPSNGAVWVNGTQYAQPALITALTTLLAQYLTVENLRGQLDVATTARKASEKSDRAFIEDVIEALIQYFGVSSNKLPDFGIKAKKAPTPLTAAQLVQKKERANATRALRGTKGKRQKAALKSTVTPTISTSVAEPASSATESPPATPASTPASK